MTEPAVALPRRREIAELYVASHGSKPHGGLYRFRVTDGRWSGGQSATVADMAALAKHPSLPVVYGVSATGAGTVHAWDVSGNDARLLTETSTLGVEPCHLAVGPDARILVVANYETGTLAVWPLTSDGALDGDAELIGLAGSSIETDRQDRAHPHQIVFTHETMLVVDLGADAVHVFAVSPGGKGAAAFTAVADVAVPAGTGPRHLVRLPHGAVAFTGELGSTVVTGRLGGHPPEWRTSPSTDRTHPVSRRPRNYPGDIQSSPDGRFVYVANRGYDTIATFAVGAGAPRLVGEMDSGVHWPQHLLLADDVLLVAGRDSSAVVALALVDGVPVESSTLFECPGASWLQPIYQAQG